MISSDTFESHRPRLRTLAYRLLGSWSDAEDAVQDAYLRWESARHTVEDPGKWLPRVVTNICLDLRKSSRATREVYVGPWLPEPVATEGGRLGGEAVDPGEISLAFLAVLERLSPLERAVYVLSEAFDLDPREMAATVGRSEAAVRQLLHRARTHVSAGRPRFPASPETHRRMLTAFVVACTTGDILGLQALLAADVVATSDGGGQAHAARKPVRGASRVARFLLGIANKAPPGVINELRELNGAPAIVATSAGEPLVALQLVIDEERITSVLLIVNPDKLRHLG